MTLDLAVLQLETFYVVSSSLTVTHSLTLSLSLTHSLTVTHSFTLHTLAHSTPSPSHCLAVDGSNPHEHKHRSKFRRHRRTASTGSSNFANFFSDTSLETKQPAAPPTSSATLPLAVAKQQQAHMSRPVSADSTRYEAHSPPAAAGTTSTSDRVSVYARNVAENIDMLTTQSDEELTKERQGPAKPESSSSKFRFPRYFRSQSKQNSSAKQSAAGKPPTGKATSKPPPQQDSDKVKE